MNESVLKVIELYSTADQKMSKSRKRTIKRQTN